MKPVRQAPPPVLGELVKLKIDAQDLEFAAVKDLAKQKAREICPDPMLLSWYIGETGVSYPQFACGGGDQPPWVVYAAARGGNLTVNVNDGAYVFVYLKL